MITRLPSSYGVITWETGNFLRAVQTERFSVEIFVSIKTSITFYQMTFSNRHLSDLGMFVK